MNKANDLPPPDAELDASGIPFQPPRARTIGVLLVAACCLVSTIVPLIVWGSISNHPQLRGGLRLEAIAGGLAGIVPWIVVTWLWLKTWRDLPKRGQTAFVVIMAAMVAGTLAGAMLFLSGLAGSICQQNCGGY
jgi:hypothetical protein